MNYFIYCAQLSQNRHFKESRLTYASLSVRLVSHSGIFPPPSVFLPIFFFLPFSASSAVLGFAPKRFAF